MVRIISDTSTLYSSAQAREAGFDVAPLSVTIGGKSYLDLNSFMKQYEKQQQYAQEHNIETDTNTNTEKGSTSNG